MIEYKSGDLLNASEDIIAHQVNCYGTAGGLAYDVFEKWPDARNDYMQVAGFPGGRVRRGAMLGRAQLTGQQRDGHIIANLFGQYSPGRDYRPAALESALRQLADFARRTGRSVALPHRLSCGICGGDWDEVQDIIRRAMWGVDVAIYQREG